MGALRFLVPAAGKQTLRNAIRPMRLECRAGRLASRPAGWAVVLCLLLSGASLRAAEQAQEEVPEAVDGTETSEAATRSGYEDVPQVGGPTSPSVALLRADLEKEPAVAMSGWADRLSENWFATKQRIFDSHGLAFGFSYNMLGQRLGSDAETSHTGGGVFDALLSWTLLGRESGNTGTLVLLAENQHRLGSEFAPETAGLVAGSIVPTASFSDFGWHLNNLHWSQKLAGDAAVLVVGIVDTVDYVDYYAFNDPLTAFSSYAFAGTPTIALPDPGLGAMFRLAGDQVYLSAGVADGGATAGEFDPGGFFSNDALFSHLEFGVTPSYRQRLVENAHVTFWHQADSTALQVQEDWGVAVSISSRLTERIEPFLRAGISKGRTTLLKRSVSAGAGFRRRSFDLIGVGLNWGRPAAGARDQYTAEVFYRFQFGPVTTLTPHLQVIRDPALDPEQRWLTALGLRARIAL